jgi:hypothetical protein
MSEQSSSCNYTSHEFEQVALNRFRLLVDFIPSECKIFREPWDCSTVLCLDFQACPYFLEVTKEKTDSLLTAVRNLGLAKSIIFRLGNQVKGWRSVKYSDRQY